MEKLTGVFMNKEFVGVDLGGTKTIAASSDENGKIIGKCQEKTPVALKDGLEMIIRMIKEVSSSPAAIGCACGGPLDWKNGVVSPVHMPEWSGVPLKDIIENELSCPFYVDV